MKYCAKRKHFWWLVVKLSDQTWPLGWLGQGRVVQGAGKDQDQCVRTLENFASEMTESVTSNVIAPLACACNIKDLEKVLEGINYLNSRYTVTSTNCVHDGCLLYKHLNHTITFVYNREELELYQGLSTPYGTTLCQLSARRSSVTSRCCYIVLCKIFLTAIL